MWGGSGEKYPSMGRISPYLASPLPLPYTDWQPTYRLVMKVQAPLDPLIKRYLRFPENRKYLNTKSKNKTNIKYVK